MIQVIFTYNESFLSKLIRSLTKEPVSHVSIKCGELVIQSNFMGVHIRPLNEFLKKSKILHSIDLGFSEQLMTKILNSIAKNSGHMYDFGALLFIGLCLWARAKLHISLPKSNLWQCTGMFLCTEFVTSTLDNKEDSMITPYQLYNKLLNIS